MVTSYSIRLAQAQINRNLVTKSIVNLEFGLRTSFALMVIGERFQLKTGNLMQGRGLTNNF